MSQENWAIVINKDISEIELQLALQCAPFITGLKISNLLNIEKDDFPKVKEMINHSHISWYLLLEREDKVAILLYHKESLQEYMEKKKVIEMLFSAGYRDFSLEGILDELSYRYKKHMENKGDFPHEMGLILGYPVEDVEGFVKHKGKNSLCTGYWKVYKNKDKKLEMFEIFENAKETLVELLSYGVRMEDIIGMSYRYMGTKMMQINY